MWRFRYLFFFRIQTVVTPRAWQLSFFFSPQRFRIQF